jgi:protein-disulfide isomerase
MSGKQAKRRRKHVAAPPRVAAGGERRRASPRVLLVALIGALVVAGAAVAIALAVDGGSKSSDSGPSVGSLTNALPESDVVQREFAGIPQHGLVLGSPNAPVTMITYIDLQCPGCRAFETGIMPTIVRKFVRTGKLKVEARPLHFIGPDSLPARNAAIAAGYQNRAFNFMQVTYVNQGVENSGWLNKAFIERAAQSVPGLKVREVLDQRSSGGVKAAGRKIDSQANADEVPVTPSLYVARTGSKPRYVSATVTFDTAKLVALIRSNV